MTLRTAAIFTLGCRLNQAESDLLTDHLRRAGFRPVPWATKHVDVRIVNGCVVTANAARKTRRAVRSVRRRDPNTFLVLAGCPVAPAACEPLAELPADLCLPNGVKSRLIEHLPDALLPRPQGLGTNPDAVEGECLPVRRTQTGPHEPTPSTVPDPFRDDFAEFATAFPGERTRANLKVQEGCPYGCSYCIVPAVRGAARSRDRADILREAEELLGTGVRELVLTGVHTSLYRSAHGGLPELVEALLALGPRVRIRLSSLEPGPDIEPLIGLMASTPRVCRFLHLPVQHADDDILTAMRRRTGFAEFATQVWRAYEQIPGVCLGTDVLVGFPGETEAAFARSIERLEALPLGLMHVFPYSPRPGTEAAKWNGRVPKTTVDRRRATLLELAQTKTAQFATAQCGRSVEVLIENTDNNGTATGWSDNYLRTAFQADDARENTLRTVEVTHFCGDRKVSGQTCDQ